jgi:hypothetical protein
LGAAPAKIGVEEGLRGGLSRKQLLRRGYYKTSLPLRGPVRITLFYGVL